MCNWFKATKKRKIVWKLVWKLNETFEKYDDVESELNIKSHFYV